MYSFLAKSAKPFALKTHLKSDVKFSIAEGKWDPPPETVKLCLVEKHFKRLWFINLHFN